MSSKIEFVYKGGAEDRSYAGGHDFMDLQCRQGKFVDFSQITREQTDSLHKADVILQDPDEIDGLTIQKGGLKYVSS